VNKERECKDSSHSNFISHSSQLRIERVQALTDISCLVLYASAVHKATKTCVVIAMKPTHQLQIHPIVHN